MKRASPAFAVRTVALWLAVAVALPPHVLAAGAKTLNLPVVPSSPAARVPGLSASLPGLKPLLPLPAPERLLPAGPSQGLAPARVLETLAAGLPAPDAALTGLDAGQPGEAPAASAGLGATYDGQVGQRPSAEPDASAVSAQAWQRPPPTRTVEQKDDYHGTTVSDPYRWLEDLESPDTKAFIEAQNRASSGSLAPIPSQEPLRRRLTELWNYERYGMPVKHGKRWIFYHNDGLQNQSVLYKAKRLYGPAEVLLDPNKLSEDGTVALSGSSFSEDGRYLAYSLSRNGADWQEWRVRDVETGQDLPDLLQWSKFSGASWKRDGSGFYYSRMEAPKPGQEGQASDTQRKVYFHKLGDPQEKDALVYERPDKPEWGFSAGETDDSRFLLVYQSEGTESKNRIFIQDLEKKGSQPEPLFGDFDAQYTVVHTEGDRFYVLTTKDAPRGRLVLVDRRKPDPKNWKEVLPQGRGVLEDVTWVDGRVVALRSEDAHSVLKIYGPRGGFQREVKLPTIGSASGASWVHSSLNRTKRRRDLAAFSFTSFTHPNTVYRLNTATGKTRAFRPPRVKFDPKRFEASQVFYASKDGTKVPMFLIHKKGLKRDGASPTLLYGYGGFNISLTPSFSKEQVAWLELGGVYAVANLRGGGEYGEDWHEAGRLSRKQNVFDDFIAAAEWLVREGYTRPEKLAVNGGSNGGLLVGAVMTQRPDLFAAAVPEVGVLDMLRYHLFTAGRYWTVEYGRSDKKEDFDTLIKYSPLHNVRRGVRYPATLVTTGDHDDRVVPSHSFKFAAALQAAQAPDAPPVLLRVETNAGHGAGKPLAKVIQEIADVLSFLWKVLGMAPPPWPVPPAGAGDPRSRPQA